MLSKNVLLDYNTTAVFQFRTPGLLVCVLNSGRTKCNKKKVKTTRGKKQHFFAVNIYGLIFQKKKIQRKKSTTQSSRFELVLAVR